MSYGQQIETHQQAIEKVYKKLSALRPYVNNDEVIYFNNVLRNLTLAKTQLSAMLGEVMNTARHNTVINPPKQ